MTHLLNCIAAARGIINDLYLLPFKWSSSATHYTTGDGGSCGSRELLTLRV